MAQITIKPGNYSVKELLDLLQFDFEKEAAVEGSDGQYTDHRRVQLGNLGFDSLEDRITVPESAEYLVVTLDGKEAVKAKVKQ